VVSEDYALMMMVQAQGVLRKNFCYIFTQGARSENYCSAYKGNTIVIKPIFHIIPFPVAFELLCSLA